MFLHKRNCVWLYHCKFITSAYSHIHKRYITYDGLFYMLCLWIILYCEIWGSQIGVASSLSLSGVWRCVVAWVVLTLQRNIEPSSAGSSSVVAESWKLIQYNLSKCQELLIQRLESLSFSVRVYFLKSMEKFSWMSGRECQEIKSKILSALIFHSLWLKIQTFLYG